MAREPHRLLLLSTGVLSGALVVLELLSFRLWAATLGRTPGYLVVAGATGMFALGAAATAVRSGRRRWTAPKLARRGATLAMLASAATLAATIAVSWLAALVEAKASAEVAVYLVAAGWTLPFFFGGAALGAVFTYCAEAVGRVGFAEAAGGAVGAALVPAVLAVGAPRGALGVAAVLGLASLGLAWVGRRAHPAWGPLLALPLAAMSLIAGDVGEPWLKLRPPRSRLSGVAYRAWTAVGMVAVERTAGGEGEYSVDAEGPVVMARVERAGRAKLKEHPVDLGYVLQGSAEGRVLVIGSGGGREVQVALANGYPHVDTVERNPAVVNGLMLDQYADITGHLFARRESVAVRLGDGRVALPRHEPGYEHIVVAGAEAYLQAPPRLLATDGRLYTEDAIAHYLSLLAPSGVLVLRRHAAQAPAAVGAAVAAMGVPLDEALRRLFVCSTRSGAHAALLVARAPFTERQDNLLRKHCQRKRFVVELPLAGPSSAPSRGTGEPPRSKRKPRPPSPAQEERAAELLAGVAPTDDQPYPRAAAGWSGARAEARLALQELSIESSNGRTKGAEDDDVAAIAPAAAPGAVPYGAWVAGAALALLLGLLAWAIPPPSGDTARPPVRLRLALVLFGVALGGAQLGIGDVALRLTGALGDGWALVVPLGLAGVAGGRLLVEAVPFARLRAAGVGAALLGAACLLAVYAASPRLADWLSASEGVRVGTAALAVFLSGLGLGAPLAVALRLVVSWAPGAVGWGHGAHAGGWAVGAVGGALFTWSYGVAELLAVCVLPLALAALLLTLTRRGSHAGGPWPAM